MQPPKGNIGKQVFPRGESFLEVLDETAESERQRKIDKASDDEQNDAEQLRSR